MPFGAKLRRSLGHAKHCDLHCLYFLWPHLGKPGCPVQDTQELVPVCPHRYDGLTQRRGWPLPWRSSSGWCGWQPGRSELKVFDSITYPAWRLQVPSRGFCVSGWSWVLSCLKRQCVGHFPRFSVQKQTCGSCRWLQQGLILSCLGGLPMYWEYLLNTFSKRPGWDS